MLVASTPYPWYRVEIVNKQLWLTARLGLFPEPVDCLIKIHDIWPLYNSTVHIDIVLILLKSFLYAALCTRYDTSGIRSILRASDDTDS